MKRAACGASWYTALVFAMSLSRVHRRWVFAALLGACTGALAAVLHHGEPTAPSPVPTAVAVPALGVPDAPLPEPAASRAISPASVQTRPPPTPSEPRLYAKTRFVWIRERPDWGSQWIGYLWPGGSVKLSSTTPLYARGCNAWYAVLPRGYVCLDGKRVTLDKTDPQFVEVSRHTPDLFGPSPYRYGASLGAERYETLPDRNEQRVREPGLADHLSRVERARQGGARDETLVGVDLTLAPEDAVAFARLPIEIQVQRSNLHRDSTVAFVGEYTHDARTFLLTPDLVWVPKDRVRPFPLVGFHGVKLGADVTLPIAFFREKDRPAFQRLDSGKFERATAVFSRLSWVALTGRTEVHGADVYAETQKAGLWIAESDAVIPKLRESTPWGAAIGTSDTNSQRPRGRATWIDTSVYGGWLIAYEDTRPIFTTLVAPGRGGALPANAANLTATSSTPLGVFPVSGKFVTANMDGPDNITHSDVPWVQNFRGPHAIHGAYWHDAWGERVSGGCLNVSPEDGRFLFDFTDPKLPEGWHGVRWAPELEAATLVVVHP